MKLGFIYPYTDPSASTLLTAAQIASNELSQAGNSTTILPQDSGDDPDTAWAAYQSLVAQSVDGVIVYGNPYVIANVTRSVEATNHTVLSISSDRCLVGTDRLKNSLFLVPHDMHQTLAFLELAALFQWNSVNVLYTNEIYGQTLLQEFQWSAARWGITAQVTSLSVDSNSQITNLASLNMTYLSNAGVTPVFCFVNASNPQALISQVHTLKLDQAGFVWVLADAIVEDSIQGTTGLDGMLGFVLSGGRWKLDQNLFLEAPSYVFSLGARLAYDAVHTYFKGITNTLKSGGSITDASELMAGLQKVDFIGSSGYITWTNRAELYSTATRLTSTYRSSVFYRLLSYNGTGYGSKVGKWTSLRGLDFDQPGTTLSVSGGMTLAPSINFDSGVSVPGAVDASVLGPPAFQWSQIPDYGSNFDARFGGCLLFSQKNDFLYFVAGTNNPATPVFRDIWRYDFRMESWSPVNVLTSDPGPRVYSSCAIDDVNDQLYIFGGTTKQGSSNDVWTFYINDFRWQQLFPGRSPSPRLDPARWGVSNGFYIMSGQSAASTDDMWFFDYDLQTWTQKSTPPTPAGAPRNGPMFATGYQMVNGTNEPVLYTFGGGQNDNLYVYYTWNDTWESYPIHNANDTVSTAFQTYSSDGVTWILNDTLYTYFGWNNNTQLDTNGVYTLDLRCPGPTCAWGEAIGSFNTGARDSLAGLMYGTDLLAIAGWGDRLHNDVESYSIKDLDTTQANSDRTLPPARTGHAGCIITNQLFVFGGTGYSLQIGVSTAVLDDLWALNLDTKEWSSVPPAGTPPSPRYGHSFTAAGSQAVVFAGASSDTVFYNDVYIYSTISGSWRQANFGTSTPPPPRIEHSVVATSTTTILVYGGRDTTGKVLTDLWSFDVVQETWTNITIPFLPLGSCSQTYTVQATDVGATAAQTCNTIANENGLNCKQLQSYNPNFNWTQSPTVGSSLCVQQSNNSCTFTSYPSAMSAALVGELMYFFGGWDSSYVLYACTFSLNITSYTWNVGLTPMPGGARNHMGVTNVGQSFIFLFGGSNYYPMFNDLWAYQTLSDTWSSQPVWSGSAQQKASNNYTLIAAPQGPNVLGSPVLGYYGHSIVLFGGYGPEFVNTGQGNLYQKQTWLFNVGPVCVSPAPVGLPEILPGATCIECSPGTVNATCISTPPGSYTIPALQSGVIPPYTTQPCVGGFYNPASGAASVSLCVPCSAGYYAPNILPGLSGLTNLLGASACLQCSANESCPISTSEPKPIVQTVNNSGITFNSSQPVGIPVRTAESDAISQKLLLACAIFSIFVAIFGLMTIPQYLASVDLIYAEKHATMANTPVFNRPTRWGGVCTIVFILLALALVLSILVAYSIDNNYETRSLVPDSGNPPAHWVANFILIGGSSDYNTCIQNTAGTCASMVTVGSAGSLNGTPSFTCTFNPQDSTANGASTCTATWDCPDCAFVTGEATLEADFLQDGTFAQAIAWNFTSDSGYPPAQVSSLWGQLQAQASFLIRSLSNPTNVIIQATPVSYIDDATSATTQGYKLTYVDSTLGTQVTPAQFPEQNGVSVVFSLTKTENSLEVDLRQKVTPLALVSQILGTVAGIIGAVAFAMTLFETGETQLRKFLGEKPSKDDKKLAIYQTAWLDLVEYQAKERPLVLKRQADEAFEKGIVELRGGTLDPLTGERKEPSPERAFAHFQDAARFGHAEGQYQLGMHLYKGIGCKRDIPEAIETWKKAADQFHVNAAYELGMYYRKGGKKDYKKSLRYLREAAEEDHVDAMYWAAIALENGEGDKRYFPEARYWYDKAAKKGDVRAKEALNRPPFLSTAPEQPPQEEDDEEDDDYEEPVDTAPPSGSPLLDPAASPSS